MPAGTSCQRSRVERTDARVSAVADVDNAFTNADSRGTEYTLAPGALYLPGRKAENLSHLTRGGIDHINRPGVSSGYPDGVRAGVVSDIVHGNIACVVIRK